MKTRFFLCRHGETQWNVVKRLQGRLNSELTEKGQTQANAIAQALMNQDIDVIVSSPLGRARLSAEICQSQLDRPLEIIEGLTERHFGQWQGELFEGLRNHADFSEIFFEVTDTPPPGGESALAASNRFELSLKTLAEKHQCKRLLVITHGDVLRSFFAQLKQREFCDAYSQYGNGKFFEVEYCHQQQSFRPIDSKVES